MQTTTERPVRAVGRSGGRGPAAHPAPPHRARSAAARARRPPSRPRQVRAPLATGRGPAGALPAVDLSPVAPTRGVRALLVTFCGLTAAAVLSLAVLADRTAETFAWTIEPAVDRRVPRLRVRRGLRAERARGAVAGLARGPHPVVTVLVFTWLTAGATSYHLHRLHVVDPGAGPVAEAAAWFWIAVYVVIPVAMTVVLRRQRHVAGPDHRVTPAVPVPRALAVVLVGEGLVLGAAGLALLVRCLSSHVTPAVPGHHAPHGRPAVAAAADPLWPWTLAPLGAGVVAAWLLAFAVAVALCLADGDLARLRIATAAYTTFGAAELLNLLRFREQVAWSTPAAWLLLVVAVAVTATGAAGWLLARRPTASR